MDHWSLHTTVGVLLHLKASYTQRTKAHHLCRPSSYEANEMVEKVMQDLSHPGTDSVKLPTLLSKRKDTALGVSPSDIHLYRKAVLGHQGKFPVHMVYIYINTSSEQRKSWTHIQPCVSHSLWQAGELHVQCWNSRSQGSGVRLCSLPPLISISSSKKYPTKLMFQLETIWSLQINIARISNTVCIFYSNIQNKRSFCCWPERISSAASC